MKIDNNKVLFNNSELISLGFSPDTISKFEGIRNPEKGNEFLYDYDKIACRSSISRSKLPDKHKLIAEIQADRTAVTQDLKQQLIDSLPEKWMFYYHGADEKFFQDNYNVNYDGGKVNRATQLSICCAIMRLLHKNKRKSEIQQLTGLQSREELFAAIIFHLKKIDLYGLPQSYDRLRAKYYDWAKADETVDTDPRTIIVNGRFGNSYAQKFDERHLAVLKEVYLKANKPDLVKCWIDYSKLVTNEYGSEPVKLTRFKQICATQEVQMLAGKCRDGSSYYEVYVRPFHLRKAPEYSLSLVAGDGWMPGHSVKVMKDGRLVNKGLTVWYWMDWKSEAILSWRIRMNEDSHGIRQSFRDILSIYNVCPASVIVDKKWQEQADTKRMFEKAGVFIQDKRAYNPKSTTIERNNKEVNKLHRQLDEYWVNMTPGRSRNNHHNDEHLRDGEAMEYNDFENMILTIFNAHNNTPLDKNQGKTRLEVMQENINPSCKSYNPLEVTWMFGVRHPKVVTVRNHRIQFEIATKKYEYIIPEDKMVDFIKANVKNNKVKVYYDERFMETVDIYSYMDEKEDVADRFLCTCTNANDIKYNAAQIEMTDKDWMNFNTQQRRGKVIDNFVKKSLEEKEEVFDNTDFDRASVMAVTQENFKVANASEMGKMYEKYYKEQEKDDKSKVLVKAEKKQSDKIDHRSKFNKYKNKGFED